MDKLKKGLKNLFAPAIVLLLVAIMGVFSPIVSVAAALPNYSLRIADVTNPGDSYTISNLPARTVKVGTTIPSGELPTISNGSVKLCHAGQEITVSGDYTYREVGQYEWRFYTVDNVLFDKYVVTVTDTNYSTSMPSNVTTVAPKGLNNLQLPLPNSYSVSGKTSEVDTITGDNTNHYAVITMKDGSVYHLSALVSMANDTFAADKVTYDSKNVTIDLNGYKDSTGSLKITYVLKNQANDKILTALPLTNIEIKNVNQGEATFANIPTAPSVASLSYYSSVGLTAPTADSAKVGNDSFAVEAQTSIVKIQAYLFPTQPSKWNHKDVHVLTVENGVVKENGVASDLVEVDGLNVKVKALGWYRFQFETSTLFGYKMADSFDNYDAIEQDSNKTYVRYWSDSVHISEDKIDPNFAFVDRYDLDNYPAEYDTKFNDYLDKYDAYFSAMPTTKPSKDETSSKKLTVNFRDGLVIPAIFPHDNATAFEDIEVTSVSISQVTDVDGNSVTNNSVIKSSAASSSTFVYQKNEPLYVTFAVNGTNGANQGDNNIVVLKESVGWYKIHIEVQEKRPQYLGNNESSSSFGRYKSKDLYFYVDEESNFKCGVATDNDGNSPKIDEGNVFQVSDVYLWEGRTFDFPAPAFNDKHTGNDELQIDYYLVSMNPTVTKVIAKLDYTKGATRIKVDLDHLIDENGDEVNETDLQGYLNDATAKFYIYAVARNFNGMQADLKAKLTPSGSLVDTHFSTGVFGMHNDKDEFAQYGYAWKRAEFAFHQVADHGTASITISNISAKDDEYITGNKITIGKIQTTWSASAVDGQMSVAVYSVKSDKTLKAFDLHNTKNEVVGLYEFKRNTFMVENLAFVPGHAGDWVVVVTVKDNASDKTYTEIATIEVDNKGGYYSDFGLSDVDNGNSHTIHKTITLGDSMTLPNPNISIVGNKKPSYFAKNRDLYAYDAQGVLDDEHVVGNYTITLLGVSDPTCITGNKFTPNRGDVDYTFRYDYYLTGETTPFSVDYYNVRVNQVSDSINILMGEDYQDENVLWADVNDASALGNPTQEITNAHGVTVEYKLGANGTGTETKPAYAITLNEFVLANYGATKDFTIDSADLYPYLEPMFSTTSNTITEYRFPAIAIPNPNIIAGNISSDKDIEITVQKNGEDTMLVSSAGYINGNADKTSKIENSGDFDYYVFRPTGRFGLDVVNTSKYNAQNYTLAAKEYKGAVYTITYKSTDGTSVSYNLTIGNTKAGELGLNKGFLTYNDGKNDQAIAESTDNKLIIDKDSDGHRYVTIDMSKVFFTGNKDMEELIEQGPNGDKDDKTGYAPGSTNHVLEYYWDKVSVSVELDGSPLVGTSEWSDQDGEVEHIKNHSDFKYKFNCTSSGTYKVTIKMRNDYTNSTVTKSFEFTLDAEATNKNVNLNTVWGVILIVLSVGLLAGVIFYFIKTARATRFVDAPRAVKGDKKTTKSVAAPKDVEAPKKDAK